MFYNRTLWHGEVKQVLFVPESIEKVYNSMSFSCQASQKFPIECFLQWEVQISSNSVFEALHLNQPMGHKCNSESEPADQQSFVSEREKKSWFSLWSLVLGERKCDIKTSVHFISSQ